MSELSKLYDELEKTQPGTDESRAIAEKIVDEIGVKRGSTVHEVGCPCGFCKAGFTKF